MNTQNNIFKFKLKCSNNLNSLKDNIISGRCQSHKKILPPKKNQKPTNVFLFIP